jgi:hypothetical protein
MDDASGAVARSAYHRDVDGYIDVPAGKLVHVLASKPVVIETVGGGALDDWGNVLTPSAKLNPFRRLCVRARLSIAMRQAVGWLVTTGGSGCSAPEKRSGTRSVSIGVKM